MSRSPAPPRPSAPSRPPTPLSLPTTSAGFGSHQGAGLARRVARQALGERLVRAMVSIGVLVLLTGAAVLGSAMVQAEHRSRCEAEREQSGFGRRAALRALEEPNQQTRFLYRVSVHEGGYRVSVVVREGPFLGDAWERDATGTLRHASDICRDRSDGLWAALQGGRWSGLDDALSVLDQG